MSDETCGLGLMVSKPILVTPPEMILRLPAMGKKAGTNIFTKSVTLNPFHCFLCVHLKIGLGFSLGYCRGTAAVHCKWLYLKPRHSWHF
jgi:hypothetical protein